MTVRFVCTIIVCLINMGEYVAKTVGTSGELCKKGRKGIVKVLFIRIPKIKIEIGDGGLPSLLQSHYVPDDCRASGGVSSLGVRSKNDYEPKDALPRAR